MKEIFEKQLELNIKCGIDTLNSPNKLEYLFQYSYQLNDEVHELINAESVYQKQVEAIDILHFLVSCAQILDISYDEFDNIEDDSQTFEECLKMLMKRSHMISNCCLCKWWVAEYKEGNKLFKYVVDPKMARFNVLICWTLLKDIFKHLGMTNFKHVYFLKYNVNVNRQNSGYSIRGKTEEDNHIIEKELENVSD